MKSFLLRLQLAEPASDSEVDGIVTAVRTAVCDLAEVHLVRSQPYWKIGGRHEVLLRLSPAGGAAVRFALSALVDRLAPGGWTHGGSQDLWAVWNPASEIDFVGRGVLWACVEGEQAIDGA